MSRYGQPVGVVDSDDPNEPNPHLSLAGQFGWAFFPMRDETEVQPQRLLEVDTISGQVVLRDDGGNVRWSLVVREGDTYRYAVDATHDGATVEVELTSNAFVDADQAESHELRAVDVLRAAREGREYLDVS